MSADRVGTAMQAIRYALTLPGYLPSIFLADWYKCDPDTDIVFPLYAAWLASHPDQTEEEGR